MRSDSLKESFYFLNRARLLNVRSVPRKNSASRRTFVRTDILLADDILSRPLVSAIKRKIKKKIARSTNNSLITLIGICVRESSHSRAFSTRLIVCNDTSRYRFIGRRRDSGKARLWSFRHAFGWSFSKSHLRQGDDNGRQLEDHNSWNPNRRFFARKKSENRRKEMSDLSLD